MTVEELIAHLQRFPPLMPVGRVGYYGEFHPMGAFDFESHKTYNKDGSEGERVLNVDPADIGEPPE